MKFLPMYQLNELMRKAARKLVPMCESPSSIPAEQRGRNRALGRKCANTARLEIDGKKMCLRHAQQYALAKLLKEAQ